MHWPPTEESLRAALPATEDSRFEFKRQWYDFTSKRDKAEFAKDVLAMANATEPEQPGYIVIGIEDAKHGGGVFGVDNVPDSERLIQILSSYINPVPDFQCVHIAYAEKTVSVMRIGWTKLFPYYAIRDCAGVLDDRIVYTRRAGIIGFLRPSELEELIRQKEGRVRTPPNNDIISVGFIENGQYNTKVVARLVNLTEATISDVAIIWDVRLPAWPAAFTRYGSHHKGNLGPAETMEIEFDPADQFVLSPYQNVDFRGGTTPGTRWFDVTLRAQFRDHSGFLQQIERGISIGR